MTEDDKYNLTCQEILSKYLRTIPILTQTVEVILTIMRHIVFLYGILQYIVTDQSSQFMSDVLRDYVIYLN